MDSDSRELLNGIYEFNKQRGLKCYAYKSLTFPFFLFLI